MPEIPDGAKVPDDHRKPNVDPTGPQMIELEVRGIVLTVDPTDLDDFELMTDIGRIDDGDVSRLGVALRRIVGPSKYVALMETCRDEDTGRVSLDDGTAMFMEIFTAMQKDESDPNS